ncbi:uncharacterized protein K02A2.6-like [Uranotaenia lowii]|uniref:uncharacterized protein K02A2.6-like n=1 Tax=Uranotaenia lowii TaxID=190385 RepID=UPI002479090C|nr:uncharacterized protein K02A2.6-like [Uranotaenia lowii]
MFSDRLVIPSEFRKRCLDQIHQGHPGIQRMKAIARSYVYWSGLDSDVTSYVKLCRNCAIASKSTPISKPSLWPTPSKPWERVHVDYAGPLDGEYYLLVIDAFTKWPEIVETHRTTSISTIRILKDLFARMGMPTTLVSDNGTQFTSEEFQTFCLENGIDHLTTAPFHPQSNGQAERFVDTFKRAIRKIQEGRTTVREALATFLLTYRSTPNPSAPDGKSPAEAMFGRPIRTSLELLRPPPEPDRAPYHEDPHSQRSFAKDELVFANIYVRNKWNWFPGVILENVGRVMYNVWIDGRQVVRSHIIQLISRTEQEPEIATKTNLPLSILLDAWNLPRSPTTNEFPTQSSPVSTQNQQSLPSSTPKTLVDVHKSGLESSAGLPSPIQASSLTPPSPETVSGPIPQPSETSTSISRFQSAIEEQSAVQMPRRSSRTRRVPRRFDSYRLN